MSKLIASTVVALTVLAAGVANAAPSDKSQPFSASKFFAERALSGN